MDTYTKKDVNDNSFGELFVSRRIQVVISVFVLFIYAFLSLVATGKYAEYLGLASQPGAAKVLPNFTQLALRFERNKGQTSDEVQFISRGAGYSLFFTPNETVLSLSKNKDSQTINSIVRTRLVGGNEAPLMFEGASPLSGQVNYLLGRDKTHWKTHVPSYKEILARNVYPGIDLRYHGDKNQLEYDFIVEPYADANNIKLSFEGLTSIKIDEQGNLALRAGDAQLLHKRPIIYQMIDGERISIEGEYTLNNTVEETATLAQKSQNNQADKGFKKTDTTSVQVGFKVAAYYPDYPLVIDPILDYSTYLGAEASDRGLAVTVDNNGDVYVAGTTQSATFPTLNPINGNLDGIRSTFIAKLNKAGDELIYATYLGGSGEEGDNAVENNSLDAGNGLDITVDDLGSLYIVGATNSRDFPVVNAIQSVYGGGNTDVYLSKLSADGSNLEFSTYLGGSRQDKGYGIALDDLGDIYITGQTRSLNFPTVNALQTDSAGDSDAFVTKIAANGTSIIYSTYIGGADTDAAGAIAVNRLGQAVITGSTKSDIDFPLLNPIQATFNGGSTDVFVTQLADDGLSYVFSTYLGGNLTDEAQGIVVDSHDDIVLVGNTDSTDFPTQDALQASFGGGSDDGFISKLSFNGSGLLFSSYFGGEDADTLRKVSIDAHDDLYVVGSTKSSTIIPTTNALQSEINGNKHDLITAKLTSDGSTVLYSTYLGGSKADYGYDIAVDLEGNAYSTGVTQSSNNFPLQNAIQSIFGGVKDAFVVKIAEPIRNQAPVITSLPVLTLFTGEQYSYDVEADDDDNDTLIYSLTDSPNGMTIDDVSGVISWLTNTPATVDITVTVEDAFGGSDTQNFTLVVINSNDAPQITSTAVTAAIAGQSYSYDVNANDINGDVLTYSLDISPAGMSIDGTTGVITWTPNAAGSFNVAARVVDGEGGSDTQSFTIIVINPDVTAPIVTFTNPLNNSATNQSQQIITGFLSEAASLSIDNQSVTLNADNSFSFGPITLAEGLNIVTVIATDIAGNTRLQTLNVSLDTVAPVLTVNTPEDGLLTNQSTVSFSGTVNEPAGLTINGHAVVLQTNTNNFSADISLAEGSNTVDLIATDLAGNTASQTINVTVDTAEPTVPNIGLINRGNPANGIIMVMGLANAVEPGTLVHVINPTTGFEAYDLAQSDGSFSTDVSGFANDSFTVFTVDSAGNTSPSAILVPSAPSVLTLDEIGNKIAPLGQVTRFTVTANDSEGNKLELGVTPLPLPAGMKYNITTGELTFNPNNGQEGDYDLSFSAQSGAERVTENITITVPAPTVNAPTVLTGRILDANSMQEPVIVPLVGATVSFLSTGVSTSTDTEGYFTLSNLPANAEVFDIDTSTAQPGPNGVAYAAFREGYHLVSNVVNIVERPFYLPRLASESLTTVNPAQTTVIENPTIGVSISIAAGNAVNDSDGLPFTGQVSISEVPRNLAPANLPAFMDPKLLFTVQPVGVSYTNPAPITMTNTEGYAPGSELDLWSVDPDLGIFVIVGVGKVSADGSKIVTISGGIRANDWHAFNPPETDPDMSNPLPDPLNPCEGCPSEETASIFSLHDGHMSTGFSLPSYRSLESSRSVGFNYRSSRAYPHPVVAYNALNSVRSTVPARISYQLEVGGLLQGREIFINTSGFSESLNEPFRVALTYDASDFQSGLHDYRLKVTSHFSSSRRSSFVNGKTLVTNERNSTFGAGWMINGLYKLAVNLDNSVTMIAPSAQTKTYLTTNIADVFAAPNNDYANFIRNPDTSYTHTEKNGVKMHFNAQWQMLEREDRNGNKTSYAYDTNQRLENITDPVGLITVFAYDSNGLLTTVTDPANRITHFEYDATSNLTKVTFPDNTFETFEYDGRHLIVAHEDERQNRYTDRYDVFGRAIDGILPDGTVRTVQSKTATGLVDVSTGIGTFANPAPVVRPSNVEANFVDGRGNSSSKKLDSHGRSTLTVDELGRTTTHVRDTDSNATQTTRPIGSVVNRTFDAFGNALTKTEQFNGATTTYTYDAFNQVTSVTNPLNHTTTINRDPANGNPLSIVNHLGHTSSMLYNAQGLLTQSTSPNGLVTTYDYNPQGLMQSKTETPSALSPGNVRVTTFNYFPSGLLQTVNTPDGITLTYVYDERSMLTSVTDNLNQSISYTYDDHKNVIRTETNSADNSLALLVNSVYDNRNRLTQTSAPHNETDDSINERILDENSNLINIIDPNGNSSTNQYDAFNRLDNNTHRENGTTQYSYDDQDRITQVIAPNGVITDYTYDILSRRTQETSSDRGSISYTYDLANNVTSITEGRGITAIMSYDELERLVVKTYPNTIAGKVENVSFTYDSCDFGLSKLCNRTDESGSYSYTYDAYGNLSKTTFVETQGTNYITSYQYDDGDRLSQMTLPSGRVIDYQRDGVRRLQQIDTTLNGVAQNIVRDIQYRGDNQQIQATFGNDLIDTRTYDLQGRLNNQQLATLGNTVIDQRSYSYDKNSNILNIGTNAEDNVYGYDKLDRIIADTSNNNPNVNSTPISFSYDLNNNRLSKALQDTSLETLYQQQSNTNRISLVDAVQTGVTPIEALPNRNMVYNNVGRLYQLIEDGTLKADYLYNDAGQRTRKTIYQADGITVDSITIYHYDQMGYLVTETTQTGQLIKDYIWQEGMTPLAQIDDDGTTETIAYLYTDHLMTNRLATNELQQVVWAWEGEAFGNTPAEELTATQVNLRFPGQYFDAETNLHYNHFRYYDPELGRYITSDPLGIRAGTNTYNYVGSNSVNYDDKYGLFNPLLFMWDVGCIAFNEYSRKSKDEWNSKVTKQYKENKKLIEFEYDISIRNCFIAYKGSYGVDGHNDVCKYNECIENAIAVYDKRSLKNDNDYINGLKNNPFNNIPQCISPSFDLKPK